MLFFTSSYITGQVSFSGKESSTNKQFISQKKSSDEERVPFRVMSWNVENLFDTHHDTLKNDNEFLPDAIRHWNYTKYKKKLADIARVITAVGEWNPPALVGLCEVENDSVLRDLTQRSPLKELNYRYVMTNSPDLRGIDVALLYQRDLFKLISFHSIQATSPYKRLITCQRTIINRRHTRCNRLPPSVPIRRSQRIRTLPAPCCPNTAHGSRQPSEYPSSSTADHHGRFQ